MSRATTNPPFPRSHGTRSTHIPLRRRPSLDHQRQQARAQRNPLRRAQTYGVRALGGQWALGDPPVSRDRWVWPGLVRPWGLVDLPAPVRPFGLVDSPTPEAWSAVR
jgi:hypothetical protein